MKFFISKDDLEKLKQRVSDSLNIRIYSYPQKEFADLVECTAKESLGDSIAKCKATWLETLKVMGSPRMFLTPGEEQLIARSIQANGLEAVELALFGARAEPVTQDFDPKAYIDITRILLADKQNKPRIQKFVEFGAKARARDQVVVAKQETKEAEKAEEYCPPPEEFRALLAKAGIGRMPG